MPDPKTVLETVGLTRNFGALRAVDNVNFRLPEGQLRAIIGPNGAGKSTFFSMLMGRMRPSAGDVRLRDTSIARLSPHMISRLGVSLAFQITNIFGNLSVADNLRLATQSRRNPFVPFRNAGKRPWVEERVMLVLEQVGLTKKHDEIASNLAHGEQKYLEIGLALATDPQLLLLDEPTAGMSPEETKATGNLIRRLGKEISVVLVEHDMDVVMDVADMVTVFHQGQIIAEGNPDEIRADSEVQRVYLRGH
jgi:branched-chain amino acid transport system ATP-binding protein